MRNFGNAEEDEKPKPKPVKLDQPAGGAQAFGGGNPTDKPDGSGSDPAPPPAEPVIEFSELIKPKDAKKAISGTQRQQQSVEKLKTIAEAIHRYVEDKGHYPGSAMLHKATGKRLLSWRVELLPYLGEEELFKKFNPHQPWDGPANQPLLTEMPEVYRVPGRVGYTTNFLAPMARDSIINPINFKCPPAAVTDGLAETLLLVEGDWPQPWTKPFDWEANMQAKGVGNEAENPFLVVWANGQVGRILGGVNKKQIFHAVSRNGDEGVSAASLATMLTPSLTGDESAAEVATTDTGGDSTTPAHSGGAVSAGDPDDSRTPVPSSTELATASATIRELFHKAYTSAADDKAKLAVAKDMLGYARQRNTRPPAKYALLQAARKIAFDVGDPQIAKDIVEEVVSDFQIDAYKLRTDLVVSMHESRWSSQVSGSRGPRTELHNTVRSLLDEAIERDDFENAKLMHEIALASARRRQQVKEINELGDLRTEITRMARAYTELREQLTASGSLDDPDVAQQAGEYYCFLKGNWERGLPLLAKGADAELRRLASTETATPDQPMKRLALADAYWAASGGRDRTITVRRRLKERSLHWYELALETGQLESLDRLKAEVRLKEGSDEN